MPTLQQHLDDLDQMVDGRADIAKIRSQISLISREVAALEADYARTVEAYTQLYAAQAEETRTEYGIEFRRSAKTGGRWQAFCPSCHTPAGEDTEERHVYCSCAHSCPWGGAQIPGTLDDIIHTLGRANAA